MKTFLLFSLLSLIRIGFAQPASFSVTVTGNGQPILLISGYSCSGEVWNETVAHLKDKYKCHVLTLPGFAGVPPIKSPVLQTVRDEIIRYVRDKHIQRPILMGHSLGAFMCLWISSQEPALASKVICVDGVPFISALTNPNANADSLRRLPMYNAEAVAQNFIKLPTDSYETNVAKSMLTQVSDSTQLAV